MRSVGLKVLKNRLSEYVRLAAGGETILISDRDRVVAELIPPRETRAHSVTDAFLAETVRRGLLTPALTSGGPLPPRGGTGITLEDILSGLDSDRSER